MEKNKFRTDSWEKEYFHTKSLKHPYEIKAKCYYIVCVIKFLNVPVFVSCPSNNAKKSITRAIVGFDILIIAH